MKEVIIGATTTVCVFGAFLLFGVCLIVAVSKFVEERKRPNGQGDS